MVAVCVEKRINFIMKKPSPAATPLWYKDAVFYELHVRTFFDSTGDGIGDFQGLTKKLDYLQGLGIDCIWLLPFYPSPPSYHGNGLREIHQRSIFRTPPQPSLF